MTRPRSLRSSLSISLWLLSDAANFYEINQPITFFVMPNKIWSTFAMRTSQAGSKCCGLCDSRGEEEGENDYLTERNLSRIENEI